MRAMSSGGVLGFRSVEGLSRWIKPVVGPSQTSEEFMNTALYTRAVGGAEIRLYLYDFL